MGVCAPGGGREMPDCPITTDDFKGATWPCYRRLTLVVVKKMNGGTTGESLHGWAMQVDPWLTQVDRAWFRHLELITTRRFQTLL